MVPKGWSTNQENDRHMDQPLISTGPASICQENFVVGKPLDTALD